MLTAYHAEMPKFVPDVPADNQEMSDLLTSDYMSPLLTAYDRKIEALEIENKKVQEKNQSLEKQLQSEDDDSLRMPHTVSVFDHIQSGKCGSHVDVLREQNEILRRKYAEAAERARRLQQHLQQADEEIEEAVERLEAESKYRDQLQPLVEQYPAITNRLEQTNNLVEMYAKKQEALEADLKSERESKNSMKDKFSAEIKRLQEESDKIRKKLGKAECSGKQGEIRLGSFERRVQAVECENKDLRARKSALEEEVKTSLEMVKEKAEIIRRGMEQEAALVKQIEKLGKSESEAAIKLLEAKSELNLIKSTKSAKYRIEYEQSKKELQKKNDTIKKMSAQFSKREESWRKEISALHEEVAKQATECELQKRLFSAFKAESEDQLRIRMGEFNVMNDKISELKVAIQKAEFKRNTAVEQLERLITTLRALERIRCQEREDIEEQISVIREQKDKDKALLKEARDMIEELEQRNLQAARGEGELRAKLSASRSDMAKKIRSVESQWQAKYTACRNECQKVKELYLENEEKIEKLIQSQNEIGEKWKNENRTLLVNFQRKMREMKLQNSEMMRKISGFGSREAQLKRQRSQTKLQAEGKEQEVMKLEHTLKSNEAKLTKVARELQFSKETTERVMKENASLRQGLNYCELQLKSCQRKLELIETQK